MEHNCSTQSIIEYEDVLREILYRLPLQKSCECKVLNKNINSLISKSDFEWDKHRVMGDNAIFTTYNYQQGKFEIFGLRSNGSIEPLITSVFEAPWSHMDLNGDPPRVLGSCNGLIGVKMNYCDYMLWNPVRKEYTIFEENALRLNPIAFGMCYNSSSDEYLAVMVGTLSLNQRVDITCAELINFSTNKSKVNGMSEDLALGINGAGMVVSGVPHWIKEVFNSYREWDRKDIVFFDPNRDMFVEMDLPSEVIHGKRILGLGSLNCQSQLGIVVHDLNNREQFYDIWVMKEYGNPQSWMYTCKIPSFNVKSTCEYVNLVGIKPGEIWIHHMLSHADSEKLKLITYDLVNHKIKNVEVSSGDGAVVNLTSYEPSVISPFYY